MMNYSALKDWHNSHKESALFRRYITLNTIQPLLDTLSNLFSVAVLGYSVENRPISKVTFGTGPIRVLGWSQMHGNESTTTKALFDLFHWFESNKEESAVIRLLTEFTFTMVPMLNPDGAEAYTRINANKVDLNRDAQDCSQPESLILKELYTSLKPDYCLNLHGQRTIFGVGTPPKSAIVSFLSPSQDALRTVTHSRKKGMAIISDLNEMLQEFIPDSVGRYDDGFNINCVGDTLQHKNIPTILFEAGHFPGDYDRETTRVFMFLSLIRVFESVLLLKSEETPSSNSYFSIPENKKCFFDYIIRNIDLPEIGVTDMAIQFEEKLVGAELNFIPKIAQIAELVDFVGHLEIDLEAQKPRFSADFNFEIGTIIEKIQVNGKLPTTFSVKSNNLL
ncbi:M14 family zinc carboxypeptidase [Leeuwenhoekiella polynyae]|uniref:Zinc carboxypeptidase n=1 Tax=Leeuwenhoekiella polynyae TaxID=1550906 RepID=A0A4Q0PI35_9FLAO|nr:M14 family zinc carboxypeptidase [Leeuwenhoekiella polynyae]RXG26679.1 zinc carboxypeptidase [Leeuwenhoekiella polynyae]